MNQLLAALWSLLLALLGRRKPDSLPAGPSSPGARTRAPAAKPEAKRPREVRSNRDFAGVRVEYSPAIDGDADPGEVVWTWVAYEDDPSQGKDRPVLLIGRRGRSLVGAALTSKQKERGAQLALGPGPWDREGRASFVKLDRLIDVDPARVRREGAIVERAVFDEVVEALRARHR